MTASSEKGTLPLFRAHMDAFIPNPADFGRYVNDSNFWNLSGLLQEALLSYWLQTGNLEKIKQTRQDFQIDTPLTQEEVLTTATSQEIIRRPGPLFGLDLDPQLSLIVDLTFTPDVSQRMGKDDFTTETKGILLRERDRLLHFYPGRFSPAENIGSVTAARRYLAVLSGVSQETQYVAQHQTGLIFTAPLQKAA